MILYSGITSWQSVAQINILYWIIYRYEIPFFEQYKIEGDKPWPWKQDPEGWRRLIKKACFQVFINNTGVNITMLLIYGYLYNWQFPFLDTDLNNLPDSLTLLKQIIIFMAVDGFWFYWLHRAAHCKDKRMPLYQMIHKVHHEFQIPVSLSAMYAHPVEYGIANHFPFYAGLFLLGDKVHLFTFFFWGFIRAIETHDGHSGYEFPWSIFRIVPFCTDATYHDFHHTKNVGNYGSFSSVWDTIFDTNTDFYEAYPEGSRDYKEQKAL